MSHKKMSNVRGYAGKAAKAPSSSLMLMLPLMAVVGIVPLIVRLHVYDCGLEEYDFFQSPEDYYSLGGTADFFLYNKMVWFCIFAAVMALILGIEIIKSLKSRKSAVVTKAIEPQRILIPLGVYALMALLSSVFSAYKPYPFTGIYEQFESVWVLLGYCVVVCYAAYYIRTGRDLEYITGAIIFSTVILLFIGLTQAFFTDIFQTSFGQFFMMSAEQRAGGKMAFNFEKGRVYLTLYNPNYVGSYVTLLTPLFMALIFGTRRKYMRFVYGALAVGLILALLGSQSRAGFVGVIVSVLVLVVLLNRKLLKNWFPVALITILLVGTVYTYDNYTNGAIVRKIQNAFSLNQKEYSLTKIETLDDEVVFGYKGHELHVEFHFDYDTGNFTLNACNEDGSPVAASVAEDGYTFEMEDSQFKGIVLAPQAITNSLVGFMAKIDGEKWYFAEQDGSYYMLSEYNKLIKSNPSESFEWLERRGRFASGRGYIWSKTLPLLKDNIILGSGADTFVFEYPNTDFLSLYNGGYKGILITKPHNMYLQMGVQTGVISVIAFIVFYIWFFVRGVIVCSRLKKPGFTGCFGIGILCGTAGYMVVQLINDSCIAVAPFFWIFMGTGLACFSIASRTETTGTADLLDAKTGRK